MTLPGAYKCQSSGRAWGQPPGRHVAGKASFRERAPPRCRGKAGFLAMAGAPQQHGRRLRPGPIERYRVCAVAHRRGGVGRRWIAESGRLLSWRSCVPKGSRVAAKGTMSSGTSKFFSRRSTSFEAVASFPKGSTASALTRKPMHG